ncbi:MAG: heavy metal translocating P-type ATPase [Bacilli bacterium]
MSNCQECHNPQIEEKEEENNKLSLILLFFGIACLITAFTLSKVDSQFSEISWDLFSAPGFLSSYSFIAFIIYTIGYLVLLSSLIKNSLGEFKEKNIFNENFLMLIATIGAYAICEFPEALFVILFGIVGEMLEDYATDKAKKSIKSLVNNMPLIAHVKDKDGTIRDLDPTEVEIDSVIEVRPGEKIAIDGFVVSGNASLDLSSINGESLPQTVTDQDFVYSGSICLDSVIEIKTTKTYNDSTLSKIMKLVESEQQKKASSVKFISRFAKIYTPIVMVIAFLVFLIGFGANGFVWSGANGGKEWLFKALSILLISCPCALVISVPIAFFVGIGQASKIGVLIKGSLAMENLQKSRTFVFDKTGTLTKGNFALISQNHNDTLLIAASLETSSTHPIAKALTNAFQGETKEVTDFKNIPGLGIAGKIDGITYYLGNKELLLNNSVTDFEEADTPYKALYLAKEKKLIDVFIVADEIKPSTKDAIANLKSEGVRRTIMLSGDNKAIASSVAKEVGCDIAKGQLLPDEKLLLLKEYLKEGKTAFVGDGINDSPSLLASDTGIAMGALGSDAAIEASDIVIMDDDLLKVSEAKRLSRKTMATVYTAVIFAILIKAIIMVLVSVGLFGSWTMIVASLSDTGIMALTVLYVMHLMLYKPKYLTKKKDK